MPIFAPNLSWLWQELDPIQRLLAAANCGFDRVEMMFAGDLERRALVNALRELRLSLVMFNPFAGDVGRGERGLLALPGREAEFRRAFRAGIKLAGETGTRQLNALAGIVPPGTSEETAMNTAVANLRAVAPDAADAGITILVENINNIDAPGYLLGTVDRAADLVARTGHPTVGVQMDQYHVSMIGEDPIETHRRHADVIRHVQIADYPGRHQPGTGRERLTEFIAYLDETGYDAVIGLEFAPKGPTEEALDWLPLERRRSPSSI